MPPRLPVDDAAAAAVYGAFKLAGFFPEFSGELCMKVFPRSGLDRFAEGERLLEQGEGGRDLFLLLSGRVAIVQSFGSAAVELASLGPGVVLGEVALLRDGVRTASAVAMEPTLAFRLVYEDVGYILRHNPALAEHLASLARERTGA
ncbi:MAG: cyclic nucleotide-binding domain-containing protein [Elusimicrobiota bacterium]|nr:cyclic nucleotide-binding domain-containing protein [Elusimicrobiota bacterium]